MLGNPGHGPGKSPGALSEVSVRRDEARGWSILLLQEGLLHASATSWR